MTLVASRYRVASLLGQGGMGQVHLAHDTVLERKVAIKMLPDDAQHDTQARERFRREALAAAALDHPFICKIHEVGEHEGRDFFVMEFIEGRTLDRVARDGGLTPRQLLDCAHEVVQALDEAHRRGIVHRDLKPSNVMLTVHGHVKVLDFGLAKQVEVTRPGETEATATSLTDPGTRLGTPAYMSPEQVLGSPLDARSDVFSLGTVLHELASGTHPFLKASGADTMAAILRDPPSSTEGDLDVVPGFGRVVHRMLAKACAERFQTMSELRAELDALREGSARLTPASGSVGARAEPPERTAFVARDAELAELTRHLDRMLLGQGGIVLLGGEPGVGKTRLAREIQRVARARGCLTLTGQCYEQEGAPPFGPFAETVEQSVRLVPQAVRAVLGELAPEVATIAPVLRRVFPDIPDLPAVPPDQQRRVLFNAYLEYVRRGTQKSAVVFLFDDLHWADEPSLQLLLHVAPHLPTLRLLVVGTYRDVELDTVRPFARTLETLLRQRLAARIGVKRLTLQGVDQMLTTMSGSAPPSSLVRIVHEETDGNPFFVEEVFQHLAEEGRIFDEAGRWRSDLKADEVDVPEGVRLVISRRLERLGDDARKILTAAAVIGRSFPLDLLLAVTEASEDSVLDLLEDAAKAQLVQTERGRDARYTFVHELIRGTLVSALALPRRQRLHARVADAIERLRRSATDAHLSMLAHHLYQAGAAVEVERTTAVLTKAMARAQESCAFEEALAMAEQVHSLELPRDSAEFAMVEDVSGQALIGLHRLAEAIPHTTRAFDIWLQRGNDSGILRAAQALGHAYTWQQGMELVLPMLERALAGLSAAAVRERLWLEASRAERLAANHRFDDGLALMREVTEQARTLGDAKLLGTIQALKAGVHIDVGQISDATDAASRASDLLRGEGTLAEVDAETFLAMCLYYSGEFERLREVMASLGVMARARGHAGALWITRRFTDLSQFIITGDLEAIRDASAAELERPGNQQTKFLCTLHLAVSVLFLGDVVAARRLFDSAARQQSRSMAWTGLADVGLFALDAWAGEHAAARDRFAGLSPHLAVPGQLNLFAAWQGSCIASLALSVIDERERCGALYPALDEFTRSGCVVFATAMGVNSPELSAAVAAHAAGLFDRAAAHFANARATAERLHSRALHPLVDLWEGRFLIERGAHARPEGEAMLRAAADEFTALKMPLHLALARRWLAAASHG